MIVGYSEFMNFNEEIPTNFKKQIEAGQKIHTFRSMGKRDYKAGDKLHHAIHPRNPEQQTFSVMKCTGTQKAILHFSDSKTFTLAIDGKQLNNEEINTVAKNDGFNTTSDFASWFWHTAEKTGTHKLEMWLVHWGNLMY